jgi:WD40 repeat protein
MTVLLICIALFSGSPVFEFASTYSHDFNLIFLFDKTYQLKKELLVEKKSNAIRYMYRHKYTVWACTEDHIIRINLKSYEIIGKVDGAKINSIVYVNQNDLWGGSSDSTIRIWDAESGQVKKVIQAHDGNILVLFSYGGLVWSGGGDKTIRIWNAKTFELVAEVSEKHETISSVILVPYKILIKRDNNSSSTTIATSSATEFTELYTVWIGSWDGRITVWL